MLRTLRLGLFGLWVLLLLLQMRFDVQAAHLGATGMTPDLTDFLKWGLTQGGLVAVVLVLLWSYRRDLARLGTDERQRNELLVALITKTTAAFSELTAAVRETHESHLTAFFKNIEGLNLRE